MQRQPSLIEATWFLPQLIPNVKITNPFYFTSPRGGGGLLSRVWQGLQLLEQQLRCLSLTSSGSSCRFIRAKQGVSSFSGLSALLGSHPHLPTPAAARRPLWVASLGLPGPMSQSQAGDRQQASFIKSASCPVHHRGKL